MKKYILIITLILSNTVWAMDYEQNVPQPSSSNNPKALLLSLPNMADRKEGWKVIDSINEKNNNPKTQTDPSKKNVSESSLFVMNTARASKL